jgi:hypothetical protein
MVERNLWCYNYFMSYRKVPLIFGEYFHIYNRGNSKQIIFIDDQDRSHFLKLLYLCNSEKNINFRDDIVDKKIDAWDFERGENLVSIGAWVLMPNHFHLYITSPIPGIGEKRGAGKVDVAKKAKEKSNIALFMRKLCVSYAKYFNKRHNRAGVLFEGPFRSTHIEDDNQAKYLFSYIHLNPIKLIDPLWKDNGISNADAALEYLTIYKWSSYNDFLKIPRKENKILDIDSFPQYFSDTKDFNLEIFSWLQYKNLE